MADLLEDLLEKFDELIEVHQQVKVNVPAGAPPIVNVEAPPRPRAWIFRVQRDSEGFIETVTATPKF